MSQLREVLADLHGENAAEQLDHLLTEWPTWHWPKQTSSYALEAEGYALIQNQVRFVGTGFDARFDSALREDHKLLRRLHHAARTGRFA